MQLRSKVRLMKQFQWGVAAYVAAKAAVILLPSKDWVEPGDTALKTIYILQNCVLWLFLAALCWIFRYHPGPNAMASLLLTARLLAICSIVAAACHSSMVLKHDRFWIVSAVCHAPLYRM